MEGVIIGCQCVCSYVMYMMVSRTLSTSYHVIYDNFSTIGCCFDELDVERTIIGSTLTSSV